MSLCRANSAPAIRLKLARDLHGRSEGPVGGKVLEGPRIFYLRTCIAAGIARLRLHRCLVAARAGATIQALAELEQWRAAAGAGCRNGDGLLGQRSIRNYHAVGNG